MSYRNLQLGILLALLFCGVVTTTGCEDPSPKPREEETSERDTTQSLPNQYHFQANYEDVAGIVEILINGFPVERGGGSVTNNPIVPLDLNTALIGEGNKLTIRVEPRILRGGGLSISTVKVYGKVTRDYEGEYPVSGAKITESEVDSAYEAWKKQARAKWAEYREWEKQWLKKHPEAKEKITWKEGGALDSIRAWAERNPLTVTTTFDNEAGPDFSRIFEEAPRLLDRPATRRRLKDYAIQLRNLLRTGDAEGIYRQIRPSISEETGWFKVTRSGRRDSALAQIQEEWVQDFRTDFSRSDVRLRRWSEGRVWELSVLRPEEGRRPFFSEGPHSSYLKVYVAEIDGQLRVVRLTV